MNIVRNIELAIIPDYSFGKEETRRYAMRENGMLPICKETARTLYNVGLGVYSSGKPVNPFLVGLNQYEVKVYDWKEFYMRLYDSGYFYARAVIIGSASRVCEEIQDSNGKEEFLRKNHQELTEYIGHLTKMDRPQYGEMNKYTFDLLDEMTNRLCKLDPSLTYEEACTKLVEKIGYRPMRVSAEKKLDSLVNGNRDLRDIVENSIYSNGINYSKTRNLSEMDVMEICKAVKQDVLKSDMFRAKDKETKEERNERYKKISKEIEKCLDTDYDILQDQYNIAKNGVIESVREEVERIEQDHKSSAFEKSASRIILDALESGRYDGRTYMVLFSESSDICKKIIDYHRKYLSKNPFDFDSSLNGYIEKFNHYAYYLLDKNLKDYLGPELAFKVKLKDEIERYLKNCSKIKTQDIRNMIGERNLNLVQELLVSTIKSMWSKRDLSLKNRSFCTYYSQEHRFLDRGIVISANCKKLDAFLDIARDVTEELIHGYITFDLPKAAIQIDHGLHYYVKMPMSSIYGGYKFTIPTAYIKEDNGDFIRFRIPKDLDVTIRNNTGYIRHVMNIELPNIFDGKSKVDFTGNNIYVLHVPKEGLVAESNYKLSFKLPRCKYWPGIYSVDREDVNETPFEYEVTIYEKKDICVMRNRNVFTYVSASDLEKEVNGNRDKYVIVKNKEGTDLNELDKIPDEIKEIGLFCGLAYVKESNGRNTYKKKYTTLENGYKYLNKEKEETFSTYENAKEKVKEQKLDGLGVYLKPGSKITVLEMRGCINEKGEINSAGKDFIEKCPGCYITESIKNGSMLVFGKMEDMNFRAFSKDGHFALHTEGEIVELGGRVIQEGNSLPEFSGLGIYKIVEALFNKKQEARNVNAGLDALSKKDRVKVEEAMLFNKSGIMRRVYDGEILNGSLDFSVEVLCKQLVRYFRYNPEEMLHIVETSKIYDPSRKDNIYEASVSKAIIDYENFLENVGKNKEGEKQIVGKEVMQIGY